MMVIIKCRTWYSMQGIALSWDLIWLDHVSSVGFGFSTRILHKGSRSLQLPRTRFQSGAMWMCLDLTQTWQFRSRSVHSIERTWKFIDVHRCSTCISRATWATCVVCPFQRTWENNVDHRDSSCNSTPLLAKLYKILMGIAESLCRVRFSNLMQARSRGVI